MSRRKKKKIVLVTGATGFIGGALARTLLERGYEVRALGRNLSAGLALEALGADYRPVDLRDAKAMMRATKGVDLVVHSGAIASPWATEQEFVEVNVEGTRHVVDACRAHKVERLVYVSSSSVMTRFRDQYDLKESDSRPEEFVSTYSRTKWEGEQIVNQAHRMGLETVILRPKAVYGPGDTTILPRIVEAAKKRPFPRFGDGKAVTNVTYIDDVVEGIRLAMEKPEAVGNTYVLAGDEVSLMELVGNVLGRMGYEVASRSIDVGRAMKIGAAFEAAYGRLGISREPPLTRYTVGLFSYSQTYDTSAAEKDLGFVPQVSVWDGVERYFAHEARKKVRPPAPPAKKTSTRKKPVTVDCELFSCGKSIAADFIFRTDGGLGMLEIPTIVGLLRHPKHGVILFDTGFSRRYFAATEALPARVYRWTVPAVIDAKTEAVACVKERGIAPEDVNYILLSHFDPDHYGGLKDFPNARIICTADAWASVRGKTGIEALKVRLLPGHLPEDISARLQILPPFKGESIGPFLRSHDLFGDGTIRLVELPGHAAGQFGAFVRSANHDTVFFAADGVWTRRCLETDTVDARAHRILAANRSEQDETYRLLRRLRVEMPEVPIIPCHCPDAAAEFDVWY